MRLVCNPIIRLAITFHLGMILQYTRRRVVGSVLNNNSTSNIFQSLRLLERFHKEYKSICGGCEHLRVRIAPT